MHPRLTHPTSLTSSPGYTAQVYSSPAAHAGLPYYHQHQQQQHSRYNKAAGSNMYESSAKPGAFPRADDNHDADAQHRGEANLFETQHAQHGTKREAELQGEARSLSGSKGLSATAKPTDSAVTDPADVGLRDSLCYDATAVADPVPALQTNLTAMEAAISNTAAAALPVQPAPLQAVTAPAGSQRQAEQADPRHEAAELPPLQKAVAAKIAQPVKVPMDEPQLARMIPAGRSDKAASLPASSFSEDVLQQAVSMPSAVLAPKPALQAASLPPGNLAPIGPPAMRTMTSQGQGPLPQLAAPTLLPLPPIAQSAPAAAARTHLPSAVTAFPTPAVEHAEPSISLAGSISSSGWKPEAVQDVVLPEAALSTGLREQSGEGMQQGYQLDRFNQQAGQGAGQQVNVSAASAVMLDEAKAAGTARQAALAVLNDPVPSAPLSSQAEGSHSLPEQPFGSAQTGLISAAAAREQPPQSSVPPAATAVGLAPAVRPQELATVASMGRPQTLMAMTGPLPATGQGSDADSPVGGRPSQSETAVTVGKGSSTLTKPEDLHAAHLVHVLQAHKASQQLPAQAVQSAEMTAGQIGAALSASNSLARIPEHNDIETANAGEFWLSSSQHVVKMHSTSIVSA